MKPSEWREDGAKPGSSLLGKSVVRICLISEVDEGLLGGFEAWRVAWPRSERMGFDIRQAGV